MTFPLYALQTDSSTSFAGFTKTVQMIFCILPSGRAEATILFTLCI
jgi:hypothetical protein